MSTHEEREAELQRFLSRLKAREDARCGPGSFEHMQAKGRLMLSKRAEDLTEEEAAFLASPPPKERN